MSLFSNGTWGKSAAQEFRNYLQHTSGKQESCFKHSNFRHFYPRFTELVVIEIVELFHRWTKLEKYFIYLFICHVPVKHTHKKLFVNLPGKILFPHRFILL